MKLLLDTHTFLWLLITLVGCTPAPLPGDYGDLVQFEDDAQSNAQADPAQVVELVLTRADGTTMQLNQLVGQQNIVLVISRGLVGSLPVTVDGVESSVGGKSFCIYCSTQTSRLVANYDKFRNRNTEVVVVFPVARRSDADELQKFAAKVQGAGKTVDDFPFPIVLDIELMAVDALGIRDDLSKPATYIFDSSGQLRFGYVGQSMSDRPSIQALLDQLDRINDN